MDKAEWVKTLRCEDSNRRGRPCQEKCRSLPAQQLRQLQPTFSSSPVQPRRRSGFADYSSASCSFADLGDEDRQRLANLIKELGRLGEEKEVVECRLNEERQRQEEELRFLNEELLEQRRTVSELKSQLVEQRKKQKEEEEEEEEMRGRRGRRRSLSPGECPPSIRTRIRPFTEEIDRQLASGVWQTLPTQTLPTQTLPTQTLPIQTLPTQRLPTQTLPASPSVEAEAAQNLLRQQVQLAGRTQRQLCQRLRLLPHQRNQILRLDAEAQLDEFLVLPSPTAQPEESLLDIVESMGEPSESEDEGLPCESDDAAESAVLEDLFFV